METELHITTYSAGQTRALGKIIGEWIEVKTVIALTGDLGAGKTVWVQGLAQGLAVSEEYYITSPTYTIINEYPGRSPLFHIDLYRIEDDTDLEEIGLAEILDLNGVIAIEWAERLRAQLPADRLDVCLKIREDTVRDITFSACGQRAGNLLRKSKAATHRFQRTTP